MLGSNLGPLATQATALPARPQALISRAFFQLHFKSDEIQLNQQEPVRDRLLKFKNNLSFFDNFFLLCPHLWQFFSKLDNYV